jgi:D-glycero-D-manno-heptose 1,7-bisphosphate phosphatase
MNCTRISTDRGRRALFLDRDGVININHGYVGKIADFEFIDGIFTLCQAAMRKGYRIIVITNQSGIARNYYSRDDFYTLTRWMEHQFWRRQIHITHTYHCPHHPGQSGVWGITCTCRKPRPGMLFAAQRQFHLDLAASVLVGDSASDIECARLTGIEKRVHYRPQAEYFGPALTRHRMNNGYISRTLDAITALL